MSQKAVLEAFHKELVERGLKSTRQRELIVKRFFCLDRHISVDDLLADVRRTRASTGYATVYRTLKLLVELGFANERHFGAPDQPTLYDPLWGRSEHYHLICEDCHQIFEFEDELLDARHGEIARSLGFEVGPQRLELYGRCQREDCEHRAAQQANS